MALIKDFPKFGSGIVGSTTLPPAYYVYDAYNTARENNGAQNDLGSLGVLAVCNQFSLSNGRGTTLVGRYVRYNSTANPALLAAPGPVYWKDETFTTVTGVSTESVGGVNMVAGLMLINTTTVSGLTAATLNGNFVWIAVAGFVPGVTSIGVTYAAGDAMIGAATNFTVGKVAAGTAPTNQVIGYAASATSSSLVDILMTMPLY
jgi:hypothetical protein